MNNIRVLKVVKISKSSLRTFMYCLRMFNVQRWFALLIHIQKCFLFITKMNEYTMIGVLWSTIVILLANIEFAIVFNYGRMYLAGFIKKKYWIILAGIVQVLLIVLAIIPQNILFTFMYEHLISW